MNLKNFSVFLAIVAVALALASYLLGQQRPESRPEIQGLLWPDPKTLEEFSLLDQHGHEFGLTRLKGKWSFIFFGYTYCPDICPITLAIMSEVRNRLNKSDEINNLQTIFVSVDPERDSLQRLGEYTGYFNPEFIGLWGSEDELRSLTGQLGIFFEKHQASESGEYLVDHTAAIFLIDPQGRLVAILSSPHDADTILSNYRRIRSFIEIHS